MLRQRNRGTVVLADAQIITPVPVTDLGRARAFYGDVLGLPVLFEDPAQRIVIVGAGGSMLELGEHDASSAGHHSCAVFHLADRRTLAATVDGLRGAGVAFERRDAPVPLDWDERDIASFGSRATAWFRDPDGNLLQLYAQDAPA